MVINRKCKACDKLSRERWKGKPPKRTGPPQPRGGGFIDRFWKNVPNQPKDGCWEFSSLDAVGYGRIYTGPDAFGILPKQKTLKAHRVSYYLHYGVLPAESTHTCHRCDNPACVNPAHLFLGSPLDNTEDMSKKGRSHNQKKTHCPKGHAYTEENIYWEEYTSPATGIPRRKRKCRQCYKDREKLRTMCPHGHSYTNENTMIVTRIQKGKTITRRLCRACGFDWA